MRGGENKNHNKVFILYLFLFLDPEQVENGSNYIEHWHNYRHKNKNSCIKHHVVLYKVK